MDLASIVSFVSTSYTVFGRNATVLLLLALAIERAFDHGWIKLGKFRKEPGDIKELIRQVLASQQGLQLHYNHDTTKVLDDIASNQKIGLDLLRGNRQTLKDGFEKMHGKFDEYEKYGIPARCMPAPGK